DSKPIGPASLNHRVRGLAPSATLGINERTDALIREGRDIIKFGLGQSPFPVPEPIRAALAANAHRKAYLPVQGLPELRESVAAYHREWDDFDVTADDILVAPGSKELMFLLQLVFDCDLVIPSPCWVSYGPQARIVGRPIRRIETTRESRWRLAPEKLDELCRSEGPKPRLLILNSPGNPDGTAYTPPELEALAAVARRHQIVVLSDEIYGELHHEGGHRSLARYYPEGTIISNGLSKWCGAGGWRLGTFAFPRELAWLRKALIAVASESYSSVCAPVQYAAVDAWRRDPWMLAYLSRARSVVRALGGLGSAMLSEAGVEVQTPTGGFYLWLDLSAHRLAFEAIGIRTGAELCDRALEEVGVAFLPGAAFERPAAELTARVAYVDFDGAQALDAVATLPEGQLLDERFLESCCGPTVDGFRRLAGWIAEITGRS
ncbi:MAG: aspartate aminotransferase, partial [Bradymonadia bacterium]